MQHLQDIINLGMMISNAEDDVRSDFHALTAMKIMMLLLSIEGKPNPYHTIIGPQSYVAMLKNAYLYDSFPQIVVRYYILLVTCKKIMQINHIISILFFFVIWLSFW
ncbi:hypothetical protein ACJX0J_021670 [Zea mays]